MRQKNLKVQGENVKNFPERLKQTIGDRSASAFARACGFSQTAMAQYLSGKSEPTRLMLIAMADEGNVHLEWLMSGIGPMRKDASPSGAVEEKGDSEPFDPILMKNAIIGTLISLEKSNTLSFVAEASPLKLIADHMIAQYLTLLTIIKKENRPTEDLSVEVVEMMRKKSPSA